MALSLVQMIPVRERLCLYGGPGSGKSNAACRMMLNMPHLSFDIIDNEIDSYEAIIFEDAAYEVLRERIGDTIRIHPVNKNDWKAQLQLAQKVSAGVEPGDWFVFDLLTPTWSAVQGWFTDQVYGAGLEDYFLQRRQEVEQANEARKKKDDKAKDKRSFFVMDGQNDYGKVINPEYFRLYDTFLNCAGNVMYMCEEQMLGDQESKVTKNIFDDEKFKPAGQKSAAHQARTIVHLTNDRRGYYMSTVKDRGRALVDDVEFGEDFARAYFKDIAGWKLKPWKGE